MMLVFLIAIFSAVLHCGEDVSAADTEINAAIEAVQAIGRIGDGHEEAIGAVEKLRRSPVSEITTVLDAISKASPVGQNWFRGIARDIIRDAETVPTKVLVSYVEDRSRDAMGRSVALEILQQQAPVLAEPLIKRGMDDPSLLIRERSVAKAMDETKTLAKSDKAAAAVRYRAILEDARHPKQVSSLLASLDELGEKVTTAQAFVMVPDWKSIAPFDNVDGVGFLRNYPPEADFEDDGKIDLSASYEGKKGEVSWVDIDADASSGSVNLAEAYDKEKGAVAYLYTEFESAGERSVQIRLGCINANRCWLNGAEVMSNEVYHSGSMIDQYITNVTLKQGANRILLKVCQNEQTQSWAQKWEFQFRFTDLTGKGIADGE